MVSLWNMKFSLLYLFEFILLLLDTKEYTTLAFQLLLHLLPNKAAKGRRNRLPTSEAWQALFYSVDVSLCRYL